MKVKTLIASCILAHLSAQAAISLDGKDDSSVISEADPAMKEVAKPDNESPAKKAFEAFSAGKHDEAIAIAKPLAEKGDADAIYLLGFAHETGRGATASGEKAMEYYRQGMEKSHSDSIYRLAFLLMATQDKTQVLEAQAILEKQARTEPAIAGRILGEAFLQGRFTGQAEPDKAVSWWEKASKAGDVASMLFIARFYDGQLGFPEKIDSAIAMKYFQMASDAGNPPAMVAVASRLLFGESAAKDEARAFALLKKAIDNKEYSAYLALGTYQERVKKDSKAALAEYERGKDAGHPDCMILAAESYIEGKGTEKDIPRGLKILETAAEAGSPQAHLMLAANAIQKEKPDLLLAYRHLVAAANGGLAAAQNELGLFYLAGQLGGADAPAALSWFGRAAQAGFAAAQNNLGAMHEQGGALPQSYENAAQLYALAAQQGHAGATLALARFHAAGAATKVDKPRAWALAKIAEDRGETNAPAFLETLEKDLSEKQLAEAKAQLKLMIDPKSEAKTEAKTEKK
jgi:hypothetical protein